MLRGCLKADLRRAFGLGFCTIAFGTLGVQLACIMEFIYDEANLFIKVLAQAIAGGACAMLGMCSSTCTLDVFTMRMLPFRCVYIFTYIFNSMLKMPLSLYSLATGGARFGNAAAEILVTAVTFIAMMIALAFIFARRAREVAV